jgi:hypothetical protein
MSSSIGDKTPAQSYKDLLHLNNDNGGLLSDLSTVYSGNGIATPLRLAAEKIEADFGKGTLSSAVFDSCHFRYNAIGEVEDTYQISTTGGNYQKIILTENLTLTFLHDSEEDQAFELTLLVEQSSGGHTITLPVTVKTPGQSSISLSATAGAVDILKIITLNAGETWFAYKVASDLR